MISPIVPNTKGDVHMKFSGFNFSNITREELAVPSEQTNKCRTGTKQGGGKE